MKKMYFIAKATLMNDDGKEFTMTIHSMYKSTEEAQQGIERFLQHGYNVRKAWIE